MWPLPVIAALHTATRPGGGALRKPPRPSATRFLEEARGGRRATIYRAQEEETLSPSQEELRSQRKNVSRLHAAFSCSVFLQRFDIVLSFHAAFLCSVFVQRFDIVLSFHAAF